MNWFITPKHIDSVTQRDIDAALDGACEHVEVGKPGILVGEQDSFGPVTRFLECPECRKASREQEDEELERCADCGKDYPRKEVVMWKWYDFYAASGDEPLCVCDGCRVKIKHRLRCWRDDRDYADEMNEKFTRPRPEPREGIDFEPEPPAVEEEAKPADETPALPAEKVAFRHPNLDEVIEMVETALKGDGVLRRNGEGFVSIRQDCGGWVFSESNPPFPGSDDVYPSVEAIAQRIARRWW